MMIMSVVVAYLRDNSKRDIVGGIVDETPSLYGCDEGYRDLLCDLIQRTY